MSSERPLPRTGTKLLFKAKHLDINAHMVEGTKHGVMDGKRHRGDVVIVERGELLEREGERVAQDDPAQDSSKGEE